MAVRGRLALAGLVVATTGCTSILGDFTEATAAVTDGSPGASDAAGSQDSTTSQDSGSPDSRPEDSDAQDSGPRDSQPQDSGPLDTGSLDSSPLDTGSPDSGLQDSGSDDSQVDSTTSEAEAGCATGLSMCATGCVDLQTEASNCGACGHDCINGRCSNSTCGAFVVTQQPTTGMVAKLATDGTRVIWADGNQLAVVQVAARGGIAIVLAPSSTTWGSVGTELALANGTVAYNYGSTPPGVGSSRVDLQACKLEYSIVSPK